jgi:hypothetical protein
VRYKGEALKGGTIPFLGSGGAASPARIGSDGAYRARVRVGEAGVLVSCVDEGRMVEHLQKLSDSVRGNKTSAPEGQAPREPVLQPDPGGIRRLEHLRAEDHHPDRQEHPRLQPAVRAVFAGTGGPSWTPVGHPSSWPGHFASVVFAPAVDSKQFCRAGGGGCRGVTPRRPFGSPSHVVQARSGAGWTAGTVRRRVGGAGRHPAGATHEGAAGQTGRARLPGGAVVPPDPEAPVRRGAEGGGTHRVAGRGGARRDAPQGDSLPVEAGGLAGGAGAVLGPGGATSRRRRAPGCPPTTASSS